jgi:two-component system sensor histidine kinase SenX3
VADMADTGPGLKPILLIIERRSAGPTASHGGHPGPEDEDSLMIIEQNRSAGPAGSIPLTKWPHDRDRRHGAGRQADGGAYANTLSIVAHDLRGPLANISILIEDIERQAKAAGHAGIAGKAARADGIAGQLTRMLSALLRRARDGRDPLSLTPAPVNLVDVLELAVAVNQPLARRKSVGFRCHAIEPSTVFADAELMFEAFDNLIGNAVRHAPAGSTIDCDMEPAGASGLQVRISDEGPGFLAADLLRAFRPFSRPAASAEGSSGLGLWITRLIAERHGGRVTARNRPGGTGAELTIWLPLTETRASTLHREPASERSAVMPLTGFPDGVPA